VLLELEQVKMLEKMFLEIILQANYTKKFQLIKKILIKLKSETPMMENKLTTKKDKLN